MDIMEQHKHGNQSAQHMQNDSQEFHDSSFESTIMRGGIEVSGKCDILHIPEYEIHDLNANSPTDTHDSVGCFYEKTEDITHPRWFSRPYTSYRAPDHLAKLYDAVVSEKTHNVQGARQRVPSDLDIEAWKLCSTQHSMDAFVVDGIEFGFPLQYMGGPIYTDPLTHRNHHSAIYHPESITKYIKKECDLNALIGPFNDPPFIPWCTISPLMTRPKHGTHERRVIVDLSFPDGGVNEGISQTLLDGTEVSHHLPSVQEAVSLVREHGMEAVYLATIDISRAYRNFRTCPADWPLLVIKHNHEYFIDSALPFGSKYSSYFMQNIAEFISRALKERGITTLIYLDDILIVGEDQADANRAYDITLSLLEELGLPVAAHKLTPPCRRLVWLGIDIDLDNNVLSIPPDKLEQMRDIILKTVTLSELSTKQMQSLIGVINHLGKAVPQARLFMARLLDAMRGTNGNPIPVDKSILADVKWFELYLPTFNGRAIIPDTTPGKIIEADACLTGMGAHDFEHCYSIRVSDRMAEKHSISRLECLNCLLAARTLITPGDVGTTVLIRCDNQATVFTYKYGRAKDDVMTACARAMWLLSAQLHVNIIFEHVPGVDMDTADALSRIYIDPSKMLKL